MHILDDEQDRLLRCLTGKELCQDAKEATFVLLGVKRLR